MHCKTFKNNNVSIRRDILDGDGYESMLAFLQALTTDPNGLEVYTTGECCMGNEYVLFTVSLFVNGAYRDYLISAEELDAFNEGKAIRLVYQGKTPLFVMPSFYDSYDFEWQGVRGVLFKLCDELDEYTRNHIEWAGCTILKTCAQYAPELTSRAVFVPRGVTFAYC